MNDWHLLGPEPYRRLDGTMTTLWVWQRTCSHCPRPVLARAPAFALHSKAFERRNCDLHKKVTPAERADICAKRETERAINRMHHCTTAAPQGTAVHGEASLCTTGGRHPLAGSPPVVHDAGCGASEPAKTCTQKIADS